MQEYLRATCGQLPPSIPVLGHALERLLEHTEARVRNGVRAAGTLKMQQHHAKWLLERLGAERPLVELTSANVHELAERWLATGGAGGRPISLKTLAKRLSTLRRSLRLAAVRGELDRMPLFPEIGLPPMRPRHRVLSSHTDLRRLCDALPIDRAEWVQVAVWTCQRPGDVERMTWADVQISAETMLIRSTKTRKPFGLRVTMPTPLMRTLEARRARLTAEGRPPAATDPLVKPWPNRSRVLPLVAVRIGLPPITAMSLRHTGFTWMVRRIGLTRAAQEWGGWSDFATLSRYYAHALPAQLEQAARELESIVDEDRPANTNRAEPPSDPSNDNGTQV